MSIWLQKLVGYAWTYTTSCFFILAGVLPQCQGIRSERSDPTDFWNCSLILLQILFWIIFCFGNAFSTRLCYENLGNKNNHRVIWTLKWWYMMCWSIIDLSHHSFFHYLQLIFLSPTPTLIAEAKLIDERDGQYNHVDVTTAFRNLRGDLTNGLWVGVGALGHFCWSKRIYNTFCNLWLAPFHLGLFYIFMTSICW